MAAHNAIFLLSLCVPRKPIPWSCVWLSAGRFSGRLKKTKFVKDKVTVTGISLPPELMERGRRYANDNGFSGLSSFVRWLLTEHLTGKQTPAPAGLMLSGSNLEQGGVGSYLVPLKASHLAFRATPALKKGVERVAKAQGLKAGEWMHAVVEKAIKDGVLVRQQVSYEVVEPKASRQRKPPRPIRKSG